MAENQPMQHIVIPCDDVIVHLYCTADDVPPSLAEAAVKTERLLKEAAGNWKGITGPYRYRVDGPHDAATGQRHIHVFKKNNELFSLNWDGSGHDGSTGTQIPNKVYDFLGGAHPDLTLPPNRIIESIYTEGHLTKFGEFVNRVSIAMDDRGALESLDEAKAIFRQFLRDIGGGDWECYT